MDVPLKGRMSLRKVYYCQEATGGVSRTRLTSSYSPMDSPRRSRRPTPSHQRSQTNGRTDSPDKGGSRRSRRCSTRTPVHVGPIPVHLPHCTVFLSRPSGLLPSITVSPVPTRDGKDQTSQGVQGGWVGGSNGLGESRRPTPCRQGGPTGVASGSVDSGPLVLSIFETPSPSHRRWETGRWNGQSTPQRPREETFPGPTPRPRPSTYAGVNDTRADVEKVE